VDLFLTGNQAVSWKAKASEKWIRVSEQSGKLNEGLGQKQQRICVSIDWSKLPKRSEVSGYITFRGGGKTFKVQVTAHNPTEPGLADYKGFVETNGYISLFAQNYSRKSDKQPATWSLVEGLGHTGKALMALPLQLEPKADSLQIGKTAAFVEYDFYNFSEVAPTVTISTLPTHAVTNTTQLRYGVTIDDGPVKIVDFRTFGRSEEWKRNVLENRAERQVKYSDINKGKHTLRIYLIDPGVVLDRITIDLGGLPQAYSTIPETKYLPTKK